jgi:CheY-like chemotaxis protein
MIDTPLPVTVAAPRAAAPRGGSETILVAEDDPALRQVLRRLLERFGYTVIQAEDGLEAVSRFEAGREGIDLLLLDVIMPGRNGRQALDLIRGLSPEVPAIFLSGHAANLNDQREISLGRERLLRKPVEPEELLRAVRETLDA